MNSNEVNRIVDNIILLPKDQRMLALMRVKQTYSISEALQITEALKVKLGISDRN